MNPYKKMKIDLHLWWSNWKRLHMKPLSECDINELTKKKDFHKHMSWTFLGSTLMALSMAMHLYFFEEKADVVLNMLIILSMLALYDTKSEMNHIEQFIFLNERTEGL